MDDYPKPLQDRAMDLLFSRTDGIGLSIFRYNVPVGGGEEIRLSDRKTATVEVSPGEFDLSRDSVALGFLKGAKDRGVEHFVFFVCSPPGRMTRNGLTSGGADGGSNLNPADRDDFARYLLDYSNLVRETYELPQVAVSPLNEPQWEWGKNDRRQEGCAYTPEEAARLVREVVKQNVRRDLGFYIEAPEPGDWASAMPYATALFQDPIINTHIDQLAIHSYWTTPQQREKAVRTLREHFPDKDFAMTEYCQMQAGHDKNIESGLEMAEVIHLDLTVADVVSWQWWLGISGGNYKDGLIYCVSGDDEVEPTKRLWVLGQWSRFVRPGETRVSVTANDERLQVTSFISSDGGRLTTVIVNGGNESIDVELRGEFDDKSESAWVTDRTRDLEPMAVVAGRLQLSPQSVTTVVQVQDGPAAGR